jgi:cytochrome oxidase Cu insertion factor (SCO1/SenC/PrrC family)
MSELGGARFRAALWALLAATLVLVGLLALRARSAGGPPPPVLGDLPDFTLRDRDGRTVTRADLLGRPWIAGFIFTRCRGACPRITARMVRLGEEWRGMPRRVSFSVDPDYDTPAVLAEYARGMGADDPNWLFLTGERAAIHALVRRGFLLAVEAEGSTNSDEPIVHSSRLALVDAEGRLRGTYDSFDEEAMTRLRRDAARLR